MVLDVVLAEAAEETDGGGCRVELGKLVLLHCLPVARGGGVYGRRLEYGGGDTVCKRTIDDVPASRVNSNCAYSKSRNTYVCPVIQPTSAMQAKRSSGCTSKTYLTVKAAQRR